MDLHSSLWNRFSAHPFELGPWVQWHNLSDIICTWINTPIQGYVSCVGGDGDQYQGLESGFPACAKQETRLIVLHLELRWGI
jgi:hypothetical protein